jgi:hypothetical protein
VPVLAPYGGADYHEGPLTTGLSQPALLFGLAFRHFANRKFFDHQLPFYFSIFFYDSPITLLSSLCGIGAIVIYICSTQPQAHLLSYIEAYGRFMVISLFSLAFTDKFGQIYKPLLD